MDITLPLLISPEEKKALASLESEQEMLIPPLVHGESVGVSVTRLKRISNPTTSRIWEPVPIVSTEIKVAMGKAFQLPQAGDFSLSWGGDTTIAIGYQPTASEIADALNDLASITSAGGVTVREPDDAAGNFFIVEFNSVGARTEITGDPDNLAPLSVVDVGTLLTGNGSRNAVQTIRIVQSPGAFVILEDALPSAACTPVVLQAGDASHNQRYRISLIPIPYDGFFTISVDTAAATVEESGLISIYATEAEIVATLEAMACIAAGAVDVIAEGNFSWIIAFQGALSLQAVSIPTVAVDSLKVLPGFMGELDLATSGIDLILAGTESVTALLEVRAIPTGEGGRVWLQYQGVINDGLIDPSSGTPTPTDDNLRLFTSESVSVAGNTNLANGYIQRSFQIICAAGAGAYTRTITLQTATAINGDQMHILIELAASNNPTVEVRNATSGGTLLHSLSGTSVNAQFQFANFTFTGSAWLKISSGFLS